MSNPVSIDKAIPIPKLLMGAKAKYPWHEMEVGDSFLTDATSASSRTMVCQMNRTLAGEGKRFITRVTEQGTRVWRTK